MFGIVRRMDGLGRTVIPKEWAKELGLDKGTQMEISRFGRYIIIHRYDDKRTKYVSDESPVFLDLIQKLKTLHEKDIMLVFSIVEHLIEKEDEKE